MPLRPDRPLENLCTQCMLPCTWYVPTICTAQSTIQSQFINEMEMLSEPCFKILVIGPMVWSFPNNSKSQNINSDCRCQSISKPNDILYVQISGIELTRHFAFRPTKYFVRANWNQVNFFSPYRCEINLTNCWKIQRLFFSRVPLHIPSPTFTVSSC